MHIIGKENNWVRNISDLHTLDHTTITDIKWMHHEHKNDGLEHSFAHVLEHEAYKQQLRGHHKDHLGCGQTHHQKAHHTYDHNHDSTCQLVELMHCSLGIIQGVSQCFALNIGMHLWNHQNIVCQKMIDELRHAN